jgi:hypothetical protein
MRHQAIRPAQGAKPFYRTSLSAVLPHIEWKSLTPKGGEAA